MNILRQWVNRKNGSRTRVFELRTQQRLFLASVSHDGRARSGSPGREFCLALPQAIIIVGIVWMDMKQHGIFEAGSDLPPNPFDGEGGRDSLAD